MTMRAVVVVFVASVHVLLVAACALLAAADVPHAGPGLAGAGLGAASVLVPPSAFVAVGTVIALRRPRSIFGWGLAAYGVNFAATVFTESYAMAAASVSPPYPGHELAAWFQTWNWSFGLLLLSAILLRFPTGRLLSGRWRWTTLVQATLAAAITVAWGAVWTVRHDPTLVVGTDAYPPLATAVQGVAELAVMVLVMIGAVSLVVRYRRGTALERLQLRWLFSAAAVVAVGMAGFVVTGTGPGRGAPAVAEAIVLVGLTGVPAAMGIAVLRYRLFEIDRLIRRTVSYALVSAVLASVYAIGVLGAGVMVGDRRSDLSVALATLLAAALFGPLRRAVQSRVDSRFNRSAADAHAAVQRYAGTVRDAVDLERLLDGLTGAATAAVQPSHASVFLVAAPAVTVTGTGRT